MANAFSRLYQSYETWSFKYNCYEAVHPWTPHCSASALDVGLTVFEQAIKLYTPLYLFSQLMRRKFDYESFKGSAQSILRSTTFISANAYFVLLFFCSSRYFTKGKFHYHSVAYLPGFLASAMAVMIEKPNRRSSLAFYVANVASEALYRIYVAQGYLKPIKNGQVYLFTLSIATIMFLAKEHGFEDDPLSAAIKMIVGPEEASRNKRIRQAAARSQNFHSLSSCGGSMIEEESQEALLGVVDEKQEESTFKTGDRFSSNNINHSSQDDNSPVNGIKRTFEWLRFIFQAKHRTCPHNNCSCLYYVMKSSSRALLIGVAAKLGLKVVTKAPVLWRRPDMFRSILYDKSLIDMGLFLSAFTGLYKGSCCALRWTFNKSTANHCLLAALIAGPALMFYPSPTVALYVLWKCLETLYHEAVRRKIIKNKDLFIVILYGLATSQLFYSALMNPKHMKKSYMAFLDRMSNHRLHQVNRAVLDVFGTDASSGYEDFFPDLHPSFMSEAFVSSIWIWMIEQKFIYTNVAV